MSSDRTIWEAEYRKQRQLWAGTPSGIGDLPVRGRVLELGCGNARMLSVLLKKGIDVIALDFSFIAVRTARDCTHSVGMGDSIVADARDLPFGNSRFSAVIARHIIGHMRDEDRIIISREISRVLEPGGILIFTAFSRNDFRYRKEAAVEDGTMETKAGIRTHFFTESEVRSLFSGLTCQSFSRNRWELKVRGRIFPREEIHAIFSRISHT